MTQQGMLTLDELARRVQDGAIETVLVMFTDHFGRFMGKRFDAEFFVEDVARHGTHACNYLLTADMEMEPVPGFRFANWERGYGDFHLVPDLQTLRVASWLDKSALVLCDVEDEQTHRLTPVAPRTILRQQINRAAALDFTAQAASELEYYLFSHSYKEAHAANFHNLEPVGWYIEDYHMLQGSREEVFNAAVRRHLKQSGIPVENSKGEWGLGQHELNVRYGPVLEMADRHAIYKQCLKEVADQLGISVTFMAKVAADSAGSSSHIHLSLWSGEQNAFRGGEQVGPVQLIADLPLVSGRLAPACAGVDGFLRADDQFVQALPGGFVGAHAHRLEPRQPHRRLSRGGQRAKPAHRIAHPRRRLQPLPRLRRRPGFRAGRH
jgi:glutamine synthetase